MLNPQSPAPAPAPAPVLALTTGPASAPHSPGLTSDVDRRRVRKRATDRKSQKKHRERQKSYIKQLEDSLDALRSCHDTDERIAALLAERDHYKARYEEATARIARVLDILSVAVPVLPPRPTSSAATRTSPSPPQNFDMAPAVHLDLTCLTPLLAAEASSIADPLAMDYVDLDFGSGTQLAGGTLSEQHMSSTSRVPASVGSMLGDHPHLYLPRYCPPVGPGDRHITSMLAEASREHAAHAFDLTPPTLKRLLSPSADLLAFRLYNYIAAYGPMPMHIMLAILWVQYLLLRWHVTRSIDDFLRIPDFLRPTELQRQIPHRICAGLIVWPDMRRCLVRDALIVSPETVGTDIVAHLSSTWHPQLCVSGDLSSSMDLLVVLEQQAASQEFWRCGSEFFRQYPEYTHCHMGQAEVAGWTGPQRRGGGGGGGGAGGEGS